MNRRYNKDDMYDEIMFCFLAIHIGSLPHSIGKIRTLEGWYCVIELGLLRLLRQQFI